MSELKWHKIVQWGDASFAQVLVIPINVPECDRPAQRQELAEIRKRMAELLKP